MTSKFSKLDKFEGVDFRRWQKKMHFLLTTLKVVYVLSTPFPDYMVDETVEQIRRRSKWENDDYICRGHILNGMSDTLFNVYQNVESAKALWDGLEAKYMAEDASSKKFLDDDVAWWIDSGATTHACKDRGWFKAFQPVDDGSVLHMGNESSAPIVCVGSVVLEFTSGKNKLIKCCMFLDFSVGIIHETTAPYTPQQNGVSERKNRVLKEMVNSMLSYSGLSDGFWGEAMLTACYLLNRVPNKRNKVTPYELWYKKKPNLNYLRIWGCRAVVKLPEPKKKSLGERGIDCIFIGYAEHSKAYRFYVIAPNDFISVNIVLESRDAIFDETRFSSIPRPKKIISSTSGTNMVRQNTAYDIKYVRQNVKDRFGFEISYIRHGKL
ncbi:UNVERIFIED_CONTAM: Retrovirus-related Pol polyprotein from transposon TNT 1-94 [Sesamum latifolium]|uniref:Retrovirus-related Pol polyprotein from transposon TNT 1-94 n=1 Tax=Sesamum latifolium TaxID=2727402 RepID=A0AAW2UKM5_9LAMI